MTPPNHDSQLWNAFQRGDAAAEQSLFRQFFRPLCFFAQQITGHNAQAEDVVIEALATSFKMRERFENTSHLKSFLYKSVRNSSTNFILRQKNIAGIHEKLKAQESYLQEELNPKDIEAIQAELLAQIYQEIEALPDKCRTIFKMIFIERLSTDQIAAKLGINVQTVRTQKARALELLRTRLLKSGNMALLMMLMDWILSEELVVRG